MRSGDGKNFEKSSKFKIWGISSKNKNCKKFLKDVKAGDRLWFVKNKSQGKLLAVATYHSHNDRELGPLINISLNNEELGWTGIGEDCITADTEVHYKDMYGLSNCELLTRIKGPATIRKYDEKCRVNLPMEYSNIVRYSKITLEL